MTASWSPTATSTSAAAPSRRGGPGGSGASESPDTARHITALAVAGETLFVGGYSSAVPRAVRGSSRSACTTVARSPGTRRSMVPPPALRRGPVILPVGDTVYVGGTFTSGTHRNLAAFDATTGAIRDDFAPNPDGEVKALTLHDGRLYAGGAFTSVGGSPPPQPRRARPDDRRGGRRGTRVPTARSVRSPRAAAASSSAARSRTSPAPPGPTSPPCVSAPAAPAAGRPSRTARSTRSSRPPAASSSAARSPTSPATSASGSPGSEPADAEPPAPHSASVTRQHSGGAGRPSVRREHRKAARLRQDDVTA